VIKCFWCGTLNESNRETCASCDRNLRWSPFLHAILRPSIGGLLGASVEALSREHVYDSSEYSAALR
jgi:hypothetical protein